MAAKQNFKFEKGVPFSQRLVWKTQAKRPVNLTGYSAVLEVRETPTSAVALTMSSENGKITLGGAAGTIDLELSEVEIAELSFTSAVYKLSITPAVGTKKFLLEGKITVDPWG